MKIAVEGCCHGELDKTYAELKRLEQTTDQTVDALIICGDFQAIRNQADLLCMAVPPKYRRLGQFHEYYTGKKVAPVLTLVIGGNHEASNYSWELYHGGWLAPNIYYLGGSNCVRLDGIRIAGASGIFKGHDYNMGHYERLPYDNSSLRSVYHVRAYDVFKLSLLSPGPEVLISHDWPEGIYRHGNTQALLNSKPFFKEDIEKGDLGNPHMMTLMRELRPHWWFSAHLHVRFQAEYDHTGAGVSDWATAKAVGVYDGERSKGYGKGRGVPVRNVKNTDEIVMEESDEDTPASLPPKPEPTSVPAAGRNTDEIVMDDEDEDLAGPSNPESSIPKAEEAVQNDPDTDKVNEVLPENQENIQAPQESSTVQDESTESTHPPISTSAAGSSKPSLPATTKFLALDKCVPRRQFLEIIDIPSPQSHSPPRLTFDLEWLAISRAMHPLLSTDRRTTVQPRAELAKGWVERELDWLKNKLATPTPTSPISPSEGTSTSNQEEGPEIQGIQQFVMTASGPGKHVNPHQYPPWFTNPQTEAFCALIEVENRVNPPPKS